MNERTRLGLGVIEAALLLGVLGDALLRATPWGLNVALWVVALMAATLALTRLKGAGAAAAAVAGREGRWLWGAVALLAAAFAWRDSLTLRALDALLILGALSLLALRTRAGTLRLAGVTEYALGVLGAGANALFGVFPLIFADVKWGELPRSGWSRHAAAVTRGLLIAVPLLIVFGALFAAADAIYEGLLRDTFWFDGDVVVSHVFLTVFLAWIVGGYLRGALLAREPLATFVGRQAHVAVNLGRNAHVALNLKETKPAAPPTGGTRPATSETTANKGESNTTKEARRTNAEEQAGRDSSELRGLFSPGASIGAGVEDKESKTTDASGAQAANSEPPARQIISLGIVEIGIVIGLLDVLFFSFVAVQLGYFFGNAGHVINSAGLTFSDYARRGFFELVWVAVLALPVLLAAHWLLRKDEAGRNERLFRVLAGAMVGMLFLIMASALWRMRLYQTAYGQTELRLYTTVFMFWLGAVFVWFALTVLRGRRERFAWGAVVAGAVVVAALHVANPTDLIVRTNLARAHATGRFDAQYAVSLGDDAVPALVSGLPGLSARDRNYISNRLLYGSSEKGDWRSWNWSRARARRAIRENEASLRVWAEQWENEGGTKSAY